VNQETKSGQIFDLPTLRRLYAFVRPYQKQFYLLIGIILLNALLAPLTPLLIKYTIDSPIASGDYRQLTIMLIVMIVVTIFQGLAQFWNTYMSGWLGQHIIRDIRVQLVSEDHWFTA
jgi:ATP-binding cassette subfamily B multidrug efflux pump